VQKGVPCAKAHTRLRNLKKNTKDLGGKSKLTGKLIDELALYYSVAIEKTATRFLTAKFYMFLQSKNEGN